MSAVSHISPFSGSWYPDDPRELRALIDDLFARSEERTGRFLAANAAGFIVPHAGLVYSGTVAAAAYRHLRAAPPARVVLLGFAHRGVAPGAWLPDVHAFETPLGEMRADRAAAAQLAATGLFRILPESALCDHSVEIQLPLLQAAAPSAQVIPIYVSHLDADARAAAAEVLARLAGPGTALIASSDFTHFGRAFSYQPFPVNDWVGDRLRELDESVIDAAGSLRSELFLDTLRRTASTVCGYEPISLLLDTVRLLDGTGEIFAHTLDYQTSGEITGDYRHSVSYAALGFFPWRSLELGAEESALLLESARQTLRHYLETGKRKSISPGRDAPALDRHAAAFVTLHKGGELRGCVGRHSAGEPLGKVVPAMTLAAALEDTRFRPVDPHETDIEVEISILSPMKLAPDRGAFRVNEHGAYLVTESGRGLLLPQVATERNWTAAQFFEALARKAGVPYDAYHDSSTRLYVFRAQIVK